MYIRTAGSILALALIVGFVIYAMVTGWDIKFFILGLAATAGWALVIRYAFQSDQVNILLQEEDGEWDDMDVGLHLNEQNYLPKPQSAVIIPLDKEWLRRAGQ